MEINFDKTKLTQIAKSFGLKFIILHGSFVSGAPDKESDLDVAVLANKPLDFGMELSLSGELESAFELPASGEFDFKTLNKVDPFFRYEVVRTGKLLFGSPADYEEYKSFARRAFEEDARPLLQLEKQLARKYQLRLNKTYVK